MIIMNRLVILQPQLLSLVALPSTNYRVYIYARTRFGRGEETYIEVSTTPKAAVESPSLDVIDITESSMNVTWRAGAYYDAHVMYYGEFRKEGAADWLKSTDEVLGSWKFVPILQCGTYYEIHVVAFDGYSRVYGEVKVVRTVGFAKLKDEESDRDSRGQSNEYGKDERYDKDDHYYKSGNIHVYKNHEYDDNEKHSSFHDSNEKGYNEKPGCDERETGKGYNDPEDDYCTDDSFDNQDRDYNYDDTDYGGVEMRQRRYDDNYNKNPDSARCDNHPEIETDDHYRFSGEGPYDNYCAEPSKFDASGKPIGKTTMTAALTFV